MIGSTVVYLSICKSFTFLNSSVEPLGQFQLKLVLSILGWKGFFFQIKDRTLFKGEIKIYGKFIGMLFKYLIFFYSPSLRTTTEITLWIWSMYRPHWAVDGDPQKSLLPWINWSLVLCLASLQIILHWGSHVFCWVKVGRGGWCNHHILHPVLGGFWLMLAIVGL